MEYAYNNNFHLLIGINFFETLFGEKLSSEDKVCEEKTINISAACKQAFNLAAIQKLLVKHLIKTVALQAKHYNSKHKPHKYNIGDFVYFNSQNIKSTHPSKKLD